MTAASTAPHTTYTAAVERLAGRVLDDLLRVGDTAVLGDYLEAADDRTAALAAVRVVGADVFAPQVLTGAPLRAGDAAVVVQAFEAFPAAYLGAPTPAVPSWRDWATAQLLTRYSGHDLGIAAPESGCALVDQRDWPAWSMRMAQLSPLALPGLTGPVHDVALANPVALSRGLTRAVLRRDHPTAARLARWVALVHSTGGRAPLDPLAATEHLRLLGGGGARIRLDLAVAQRMVWVGRR